MHLADRARRQSGGACCRFSISLLASIAVRLWLADETRQATIKELRKGAHEAKIELEARKQQH